MSIGAIVAQHRLLLVSLEPMFRNIFYFRHQLKLLFRNIAHFRVSLNELFANNTHFFTPSNVKNTVFYPKRTHFLIPKEHIFSKIMTHSPQKVVP